MLILDEALEAAARLSARYIPSRQLPDKAVSLIDTACARVAVSQHATPAALEDSTRRIENLQTELDILARETALGRDSAERTAKLTAELTPTPEPITLTLFGAGLAGVAGLRRRRNAKTA